MMLDWVWVGRNMSKSKLELNVEKTVAKFRSLAARLLVQ